MVGVSAPQINMFTSDDMSPKPRNEILSNGHTSDRICLLQQDNEDSHEDINQLYNPFANMQMFKFNSISTCPHAGPLKAQIGIFYPHGPHGNRSGGPGDQDQDLGGFFFHYDSLGRGHEKYNVVSHTYLYVV